jgi:hypothetical protein
LVNHGISESVDALPIGDAPVVRWSFAVGCWKGGGVTLRADVAVIGGSGFSTFLDDPELVPGLLHLGEGGAHGPRDGGR